MIKSSSPRTGKRKARTLARTSNSSGREETPPATTPADEHGLGSDLRAHLGTQLRAAYHQVVTEPVPDRFLRLLDDLVRQERSKDEH